MAAGTACLYHGAVAVALGRIHRQRPAEALGIGGLILLMHSVLFTVWSAWGMMRLR